MSRNQPPHEQREGDQDTPTNEAGAPQRRSSGLRVATRDHRCTLTLQLPRPPTLGFRGLRAHEWIKRARWRREESREDDLTLDR